MKGLVLKGFAILANVTLVIYLTVSISKERYKNVILEAKFQEMSDRREAMFGIINDIKSDIEKCPKERSQLRRLLWKKLK